MNFIDHSKGHTPARKGDHLRHGISLNHNRCGTRLTRSWNESKYYCPGCRCEWKSEVISSFSDDAMATRFYIQTIPDSADYVIVWKTDAQSKTRYTACVPIGEAGDLERFKL